MGRSWTRTGAPTSSEVKGRKENISADAEPVREPRIHSAAGPAVKYIVAGKGGDLQVGLSLYIGASNGAASGQFLDATGVHHSEEEAVPGGIGSINGENDQTQLPFWKPTLIPTRAQSGPSQLGQAVT